MVYKVEDLKNIQYATIGVELKGSSNMEQQGYLLGLRPIATENYDVVKADQLFIWLYRKNAVHMCGPDYYYITNITVGFSKDTSSIKMFKDEPADQQEALSCLEEIIETFREKDIIRINGLIDHQKYTNVPDSIKALIDSTDTTTTDTALAKPPARTPLYGYGAGYNRSYTTYVRKEVDTISFNRTTKYDADKAIEDMASKIAEIKAETYVPPQLIHIPADDAVVEEKPTTNVVIGEYTYDDYSGY